VGKVLLAGTKPYKACLNLDDPEAMSRLEAYVNPKPR
jgi:hypothetical protein